MRGTVISKCDLYEFDERYNIFNIDLPVSSNAEKQNVIGILVPINYPYQPEMGDIVEITGTLTTYDEQKNGLRTYVLIIALYPSNLENYDPESNIISFTGKVFKKSDFMITAIGGKIQRFSLSANIQGRYIPVHCIAYDAIAKAAKNLNKHDVVEVSGKLVSRKFYYRPDILRTTTELIIDSLFVINPGAGKHANRVAEDAEKASEEITQTLNVEEDCD